VESLRALLDIEAIDSSKTEIEQDSSEEGHSPSSAEEPEQEKSKTSFLRRKR
jgi:hypothetical protein